MERSVLFAGKEYPDGREFAVAATNHNRSAVVTVAEMPKKLDGGCVCEDVYPAQWSRNSPLAARTLVVQAENACGAFREAVIIFDTSWYAGRFEDLAPETCSRAIDAMVGSYAYLVNEVLNRFKKQGEGTLVFVLKKSSSGDGGFTKPVSVLTGMAEGAFKGLGESVATTYSQDPSLKIVLAKADFGTADSHFANWLFEVLDAPNSIAGKYDAKKGPQWFKMGTKTGKGGLFNPFQKR